MDKKNLVVILSVLSLVLLAVIIFFAVKFNSVKQENRELWGQMEYEKEQMEENKARLEQEYVGLSNDLETFTLQIDNDSILKKLDEEQNKVRLLMEELRTTKATNFRRISELKAELSSVRKVLTYYIAQVDSLNKENTYLKDQNVQVTHKYNEASRKIDTLASKNEMLAEKVTIASQLEARNISVQQQTKKGKKTSRLRRTDILKVQFTISKNITATVGNKTAYIRLTNPDNQVLYTTRENLFRYEDRDILYSAKKSFEYSGQETEQTIYWIVNETLIKGTYRVDIFVDSHLVGRKEFVLD